MLGCDVCDRFGEAYCSEHKRTPDWYVERLRADVARLTAERDAALAVAREYVPRCDCGAVATHTWTTLHFCDRHAEWRMGYGLVETPLAPEIRALGPLLERPR